MSIIKRSDGTQFVIQSYRELLVQQPPSLLKREIRLLAQKHGEYVCLVKRDNGQFEAVFARELGLLLGESVWHHLQRPRNLIWCEALPDEENQLLLVVVTAGSVYIDTKTSSSGLSEDLAFLATAKEKYDVFVYGDIPLVRAGTVTDKKDVVILEKENCQSFNVLSGSLLNQLRPSDEFRLQPLALLLTSSYFKNKYIAPITTAIVSVLLVLFVWYVFFAPSKEAEKLPPPKNPFVLYRDSLATTIPDKLLGELGDVIALSSRLGGWDVTSLNFANGVYTLKVKADLGDMQQLQFVAKTYGINVSDVGSGTATLIITTNVAKRAAPTTIYNLNKVVELLIRKMQLIMAKENINVGAINNYGATKSVDVTLNLKSFAPLTFNFMGKLLANLPLSVSSIELNNDQGLYSGAVKVTIWGN